MRHKHEVSAMNKLIVPRLKNLAFDAAYEEILSNLSLCQDHRPEGKKLKVFSSAISLSPLFTSQSLINFVSKRLDYFLVGIMNDEIRKKLVEKLYAQYFATLIHDNNVDPWVFMDCVLDDSFQELVTHVSFPGSEPDLKLIPIIAKQSSQLLKLKLDFSFTKKLIIVWKIWPVITALSSLEHLTSLNLHQMDSSHKLVLMIIGHSCPLLTHLSISGFRFSPKDILSIVLGKFADHLFHQSCDFKLTWRDDMHLNLDLSEDIHLEDLKAPIEVLTPVCFTLRHLQLGDGDSNMYFDRMHVIVTSFLLHHLPRLEKMDGHCTSHGVKCLRDSLDAKKKLENHQSNRFEDTRTQLIKNQTEKFEKACKRFIATRSTHPPGFDIDNIVLNYPEFKGYLSLFTLDFVDFFSLIASSIPGFCPDLKEVMIWETSKRNFGRYSDGVPNQLKDWPKLEAITFMNMSPQNVKVILEAFALSLKSATFISCKKINLLDLLPCSQLESLRILKSSSLADTKVEPSLLAPSSVFPHLKSFESGICLNLWTSWLESKSKLTHVVLNCCNNGTQASNHFDWNNIPNMWPMIETLQIRQCGGLTMPMVSSIVPQLSSLKELSLPEKIAKNDPELAAKIWEDFNYRSTPVRFSFTKGRGKRCSLLWVVDEGSIDSDDDEDESSEDDDMKESFVDDDMEEDNTTGESDESSMDMFL